MKNHVINAVRAIVWQMPLFFLITCQCACNKYLEKKPADNLAVPSGLKDLQALLNSSSIIASSPAYGELVADNYYLSNATWNSPGTSLAERTTYVWDKDASIYADVWNFPYQIIYTNNFVLESLPKVAYDQSEQGIYNQIKATALFYRSFLFHQLAQLFCKPYSTQAQNDPGIVLRLTANVSAPSTRATVQETYDRIITDLKEAVESLPLKNTLTTAPNKVAAYGLLARVYLSMRDYVNAGSYADAALQIDSTLLDYKLLPGNLPTFRNNPELSYTSYEGYAPYDLLGPAGCNVDSVLYTSYDVNDLRKAMFFGSNGSTNYWKGSYLNDAIPHAIFDGIATDELYLIRAESEARSGNKDGAMKDLNTLLMKRYKTGTFPGLTAADAADALAKVLVERRKELVFRGLRWSDLRRFNLEGANITLKRIINGITYTLPPNDLRWVLLIPPAEITRAGIAQNPR